MPEFLLQQQEEKNRVISEIRAKKNKVRNNKGISCTSLVVDNVPHYLKRWKYETTSPITSQFHWYDNKKDIAVKILFFQRPAFTHKK